MRVRLGAAFACALLVAGLAGCGGGHSAVKGGAPIGPPIVVTSEPTTVPSSPPVTTPSPTPTPSPSASAPLTAASCIATTLSSLSLTGRVGQLIMIGTQLDSISAVDSKVTQYQLGGVFLGGRSSMSAASLKSAVAALQALAKSGVRLNIALDQEGGEVQTLKGTDFPAFPTAVVQGTWSASTLKSKTLDWSRRLAQAGITMDLAPVADTVPANNVNDNPPIGGFDREYGTDPTKVAAAITTVVGAAQSTGLTTTLKHFPGLGRVHTNTDVAGGAVDTVATTTDPYLKPFAAGIKAGSGAVMMSLASYPKLDAHNLAAFSGSIVTGLLRTKLGFTGLIISDDLGNTGAVKSIPVGDRAIRFINAGGDVALTVNATDAGVMATAMVAEAKQSAAFATKVDAAARIVLTEKYNAGLLGCSPIKA
jgi:beta-N-acetylhexosaminidase